MSAHEIIIKLISECNKANEIAIEHLGCGLVDKNSIAAAEQWLAQERGPLTDIEIINLVPSTHIQGMIDALWFARAIERAHGIGQPAVGTPVERPVGRPAPERAEPDYDDLLECQRCHGDGMDPRNDYLLPCPACQGEQH